jgi:pyruvate dehydrogenase E2 component (dihydrolipoamide acetyltransferase)
LGLVKVVVMPRLTWTMTEGVVGRWLRREGELVSQGEVICEVETEKTTDEVRAPASGALGKILVHEGGSAKVEQPIAILVQPDEQLTQAQIDELLRGFAQPVAVEAKPVEVSRAVVAPVVGEAPAERLKVSPLARKVAEEHGIDLATVKGTGPGGRITREDVLASIEKPPKAVTPRVPLVLEGVKVVKVEPMAGMRKVIAERMASSARTTARVTITTEVDVTETVRLRGSLVSEMEKKGGVRVSYTDLLVKAVAKALLEHPRVNSILIDDSIYVLGDVNIGVAVDVEEGLLVPVVHDALRKSVVEIAEELRVLVDKAKKGSLSTQEVAGGTFTITNLGTFDVDAFTPIIDAPQTAILGVGRIVEKPTMRDGQVVPRSMMTLSLSFDHRIIDGAPAARFLQTLRRILEHPELLLL